MPRITGIWVDVAVGIASSVVSLLAGYYLFKTPLTPLEIIRDFVTSSIGSFIIRKIFGRSG